MMALAKWLQHLSRPTTKSAHTQLYLGAPSLLHVPNSTYMCSASAGPRQPHKCTGSHHHPVHLPWNQWGWEEAQRKRCSSSCGDSIFSHRNASGEVSWNRRSLEALYSGVRNSPKISFLYFQQFDFLWRVSIHMHIGGTEVHMGKKASLIELVKNPKCVW